MGNWQEVVQEQQPYLKQLHYNDFSIEVSISGGQEYQISSFMQVPYVVRAESDRLDSYERLAISLVEQAAAIKGCDMVAYLHTKGVSQPHNKNKSGWRKAMQTALFHSVSDTIDVLEKESADCIGFNWQDFTRHGKGNTSIAHFSGNFWIAKASYIKRLAPWDEYYLSPRDRRTNLDVKRLGCEFWIGSYDHNGGAHPKVVSLWRQGWDTQDAKRRDWGALIQEMVASARYLYTIVE